MVKKEENKVENVEQNASEVATATEEKVVEQKTEAQNAEEVKVENVEVPENAEEISEEEAFKLAADEVNKLRDENTALKQTLAAKTAELEAVIAKTNEEAGIAGKQILDLETKVKELEEKLKDAAAGNNNTVYIELLDSFETKIDQYAGLRRERLRKEFITDLKEEIQKQKDLLKNA